MSLQVFPEPTVGALILNAQNQIFLMKTHKWGHKYAIPGGHIELGETMEQTLIREVKEETNLDISDIRFVCFFEVIFDPTFWEKKHFIFFDFVCRTTSTDVMLNDEAQEYVWTDKDKVLGFDLEDNTRRFIEKFISEPPFSL